MLRGRRDECAVLDGLLDGARAGRSGALVVRGDAGVGKTALLEYVIASAADLTVVRAVGVESEMELAFAALHQLCVPVLDRLERLPGPQCDALRVTFGLSEGPVPDRFLVGLALLSLLAEAAEERALVCVVDDAMWLDTASARALAFVARRLFAESVVLLFATRQPDDELVGLPELAVEGLEEADARELLRSVVPGRLDERVREQVLAETRGNPLALLELTRGLSPAELAGGFGLAGAPSLEGRIEERFLQRLRSLPEESQRLLLVAAADPTGDLALLWRAAERLGIAGSALDTGTGAGLIEVGTRVRFRHPLVRSAVYRAALPEQRRDAHWALAEASDPRSDPDRRAWHLAEATAGPDEAVAAELERSAERAQARGGLAAAAAFLERAVMLTTDPSLRADRALAAALTKIRSGALAAAQRLLAVAEAGSQGELQHARVDLVRAELAYVTSRGSDAALLLLKAAKRLEPIAPDLARATYLDALTAAEFAGRLAASGGSLVEVARAVSAMPPKAPGAADLFLYGLAANISQGYAAGSPILRDAVRAFADALPEQHDLHAMPLAVVGAAHLFDDAASDMISDRWAGLCRQAGALSELPLALNGRAIVLLAFGELADAASLVEEVQTAAAATGVNVGPFAAMALAAFRGDEAEASALIEATVREAPLRGEGANLCAADWATAVLNNGLGRYQEALGGAQRASEDGSDMFFSHWALAEFVEAAARTGTSETAARAFVGLPIWPAPAGRTGRSGWKPGREPCSATVMRPRACIERRSSGWDVRACV
jgi:hypothetical protein